MNKNITLSRVEKQIKQRNNFIYELVINKALYLMLLPCILLTITYKYIPLIYQIIAFEEYSPIKGITGSKWVGLQNFKYLFEMSDFWRVSKNTLIIGFGKQVINFVCALAFALLLNELISERLKKIVQTFTFFPYLVSWSVAGGIVLNLFGVEGLINSILSNIFHQKEPINFLIYSDLFRPIVFLSEAWKYMGANSIIFIAAIMSINQELYEAAYVDGAGRLKQMINITLPSITIAIVTVILLNLQYIINVGADQILVLYSPNVYDVADIFDTYIYREGTLNAKFSYATAVGLFKSAIAFFIVFFTNKLSKKYSDAHLF